MKYAVTFGRFNSISKGHEAFFDAILEKWDYLTIIVLDDIREIDNVIPQRKNTEFYNLCDSNWNVKMLPLEIRLNAMNIFKFSYEHSKKINVVSFPRVEYFPSLFNSQYPSNIYDLVFSNDQTTKFDIIKIKQFQQILDREIALVNPNKIIHNKDIKNKIKEKGDLLLYFNKEVVNYYEKEEVLNDLWKLEKN